MKEWKKFAAAMAVLSFAAAAAAMPAGAEWVQDSDGSYSYLDSNGAAVTDSWQFIDGEWYGSDGDDKRGTDW